MRHNIMTDATPCKRVWYLDTNEELLHDFIKIGLFHNGFAWVQTSLMVNYVVTINETKFNETLNGLGVIAYMYA